MQVITDRDALLAHRPDDVFARASLAPGAPLVRVRARRGDQLGAHQPPPGAGVPHGERADRGRRRPRGGGRRRPAGAGVRADRPARRLGAAPRRAAAAGGDRLGLLVDRCAAPHQPGEEGADWLADDDELLALLERASPRRMASPGDPHVLRWCGIRDASGALVACAAEVDDMANAPHLAGVAVAPEARSRGLGRAITAWLTRQLLAEGHPLVTLGMYADNEPARRAYRAIGYRDTHHWSSGRTPAGDVAAAARQP